MSDTHLKSMMKSAIWRLLGVAILATITYIFTKSWIITTLVTVIHHAAFLIIYYLHERTWLRVRNKKILRWKRWIRPFTYEIILGHLVLGTITLLLTGSWLKMTLITIVYIENKLWIYIVYDWIWEKKNGT